MNKRKLIGNILFFVVVLVVLFTVIFSLNDINDILSVISSANPLFLILAILLMFLHVFLTSITFYIVQSGLESRLKFSHTMAVGSLEYLFNAITPFSSGSQPMQAYYFNKLGAEPDESASITISNFMVYQVILTLFSTVGLILFHGKIYQVASNYMWVIIIGYVINTFMLVFFILVSTIDKVKSVLKSFFRLLGKIKPFHKKMVKLEAGTDDFVYKFQREIKSLFKRKRVLLGTSALRLLDLIIYNAIPIVLFYALGIEIKVGDYLFIIMMSAFAQTMMLWVPTPGASGGVEWAYTILFTAFASSSVIIGSMLLWRFVTFYIGIIIGLIAYFFVKRRSDKYENRHIQ